MLDRQNWVQGSNVITTGCVNLSVLFPRSAPQFPQLCKDSQLSRTVFVKINTSMCHLQSLKAILPPSRWSPRGLEPQPEGRKRGLGQGERQPRLCPAHVSRGHLKPSAGHRLQARGTCGLQSTGCICTQQNSGCSGWMGEIWGHLWDLGKREMAR